MSWQQACLHWGNGEIGDVCDKTHGSQQRRGQINGDVTGLSRTKRGSWHSGILALTSIFFGDVMEVVFQHL